MCSRYVSMNCVIMFVLLLVKLNYKKFNLYFCIYKENSFVIIFFWNGIFEKFFFSNE